MKYVKQKLLVAACIAAVSAGSALAQSTPGSTGSGETPRMLPGGSDLSERAVPITPPQVDLDEVGRDLILDPERLRNSFGVIGRTRSGEEITEPPSEDVLRSLDDAGLNPNADPAFEGERQVFGEDDRVQVSDTTGYPFRVFGLIQAASSSDNIYTCSGTLIGPRTVVTAAHCLYNHDDGGWLDEFLFAPGINGADTIPYGVWEYETAYILAGYVNNYQGYYGSVVPWDLGVLILADPVGDQLGWLGFAHDPSLGDFHANIIGYPGDKPAYTQWRATCDVTRSNVEEMLFAYDCDTYQGSSGSSVYKYDPATQDRIIYGVNVAESPQFNVAVRLNETNYNWLLSVRQ